MTERLRSKDKSRDSDLLLGADGFPVSGGRAGGRLARDVGTKDEMKRAFERPAGATRVEKSEEKKGDDNA